MSLADATLSLAWQLNATLAAFDKLVTPQEVSSWVSTNPNGSFIVQHMFTLHLMQRSTAGLQTHSSHWFHWCTLLFFPFSRYQFNLITNDVSECKQE